MKEEFDKWFDKEDGEFAVDYGQCQVGWNAARDKILEILKENVESYEGGGYPSAFIHAEIIEQIENL